MDCPPIPQFCLGFLLRSKTYLKQFPPSASIASRDFPLSSKCGLYTLQANLFSREPHTKQKLSRNHHTEHHLQIIITARVVLQWNPSYQDTLGTQ